MYSQSSRRKSSGTAVKSLQIISLAALLILASGSAAATDLNNIETITPAGTNPITITGEMDMSGNPITGYFGSQCNSGNVAVHVNNDGTLDCVDATGEVSGDFVSRSGDSMNGNLDMNGNRVNGIDQMNMIKDDSGDMSIEFQNDAWGGGGDDAYIRYQQDGSGENTELLIAAENDPDDNIELYTTESEVDIGGTTTLDLNGNPIANADWSDANDLNSGGGISDFSNAGDLNSGGSINDFSAANDLDGSGNIADFSAANDLNSAGDIDGSTTSHLSYQNQEEGDFTNNGDVFYDQSAGLYVYYGSSSNSPDGSTGAGLMWNNKNVNAGNAISLGYAGEGEPTIAVSEGGISHDNIGGVSYNDHHGTGNAIGWDGSNNIAVSSNSIGSNELTSSYDTGSAYDSRFVNLGGDAMSGSLDMSGNSVTGVNRVGGSGEHLDFNDHDYVEVQDGGGGRSEIVTQDTYINEDGVWLGDHIGDSNAHHAKTVDTSASTQCSGNDYLAGDGTCNADTTEDYHDLSDVLNDGNTANQNINLNGYDLNLASGEFIRANNDITYINADTAVRLKVGNNPIDVYDGALDLNSNAIQNADWSNANGLNSNGQVVNTKCSGNDYLAGDGTCNVDSYEANTDNQDLSNVVGQGNSISSGQTIDASAGAFRLPVGADAY